jgi:hypothetical protein
MRLNNTHSDMIQNSASRKGVPFLPETDFIMVNADKQSGSVIFYIFLAIGLLAMLTFSVIDSSRTNSTAQQGYRIAEDLYSQASNIQSAILECVYTYPDGGGDLDSDGDIDSDDNDNIPYPLEPNDANNPATNGTSDNEVRYIQCPGAPSGEEFIYDGVGTKGRFLPPPKWGFGEWDYYNDSDGVRIEIVGEDDDRASVRGVNAVAGRYEACQADVTENGACGPLCLTIWLVRATCP